ncbi:hypothetical protein IW150_007061 [Coemansia sp. RSA 2607]|nr:hypothetical protein IW150_007061 [Coemansia sp. RSA 2607]
MAMGTPVQTNSREDTKPSLSSVYGAYNLPPRPPIFGSSSASSSSPMMAPAAPTSMPSSAAAAYSAYSWAMLPSVAQTISNSSMQYSGTLAQQAFSLSSLSSNSNERRDGSSYMPLQFGTAAGVSPTTATGASALPFVYGSYGST